MAWRLLDVGIDTANAFMNAFAKVSRFIIDENLGPEFAPALCQLGYNATDVFALKVNGRADEDVFAAAWRERRILLTRDRDFLDDRRFPPHRNPGVVVLPARNDTALIGALVYALPLLQNGRELWNGLKIVVSENGRVTVIGPNHDTGIRGITHYKLRMTGPPLIWMADKFKTVADADCST